jgi:hypothetical protein
MEVKTCIKICLICAIILIEFVILISNIIFFNEESITHEKLNKSLPTIIDVVEKRLSIADEISQGLNKKILEAIFVYDYNHNSNRIINELEKKFEEHVPKKLEEKNFNLIFSKFYAKNKTFIGLASDPIEKDQKLV